MKCRNCGAEVSEGAKFCENCGARVEAEVNETFSPIPEEPAKKKMPVWAKVAAGLVGVVAILAVLACCSKVVGNTFRKWFLSPEKYLAYVLKENFGESINDGLTVYDEYISRAQNPDNIDSNIKFEIALGDELSDYVKEMAGYYSSEADWVTWVKKATIEYGVNSYKGAGEVRAKVGANDVDLVSLSVYATPDGDVYLSVPEILSKTILVKVDPEELQEILKFKDMVNSIYKDLPTKPELQSISKKYLKAVFDNINGVKRTNDVISVEDISAKATVLTMDIDDLLLTNIEVDVLEEFLKDEEFEKIWMRMYDAYEEVVSNSGSVISDKAESYDEIKKNAQKALDEAKEKLALYKEDQLVSEVKATITFYVDNKGTISGCALKNDEFEYSYIRPSKGGRFGIETVVNSVGDNGDFGNLTVVGTGKESASVITADMTATVDGEKFFDIKINNIDKSISKKGEGSFDVAVTNVNFGETSESDLEVIKEIIGDTNVGLYYKGKISKDNTEVSMSLGNGDKDLFSLAAVAEVKNGSAKSVDGMDDVVELDFDDDAVFAKLLNVVEAETFVKNLREAGANEDLASTIENTIVYLKSLAAYY
ncbi:MAG: zinc-ribbon domain-containing protein [Lachnospiraceae bacterium]|nr:zinc-ribbon domain-containing protein [Lachnospiraceae bacterium]